MGHDIDRTALTMATVSRRQTTVLFCDLVDSTGLSQRLDAEDWLEELQAYRAIVHDVAQRYDAHVARVSGDGIDLYFGYPHAAEDDAVRAIHAGLAIVQALVQRVHDHPAGTPLQARIGIATGWLAVNMQDTSATAGATLNLAARLQALAPPNGVLVAPATRRVAGPQFVYEPLGDRELKGFDSPVAVALVRSAMALHSPSAWRWRGRTAPLRGREDAWAQLFAWWREPTPFVAALSAEPGMGKSTLAHAFTAELQTDGVVVVHLQGSPFHRNTPLHPLAERVRALAGCEPTDTHTAQWARIEGHVQALGLHDPVEHQLLAQWLGLAPVGRWTPLALPPKAQQQGLQQALLRLLLAHARGQRLLVWVEDLHWLDPSSLQWLAQLCQWSASMSSPGPAPGVLITTRPQADPQALLRQALPSLDAWALRKLDLVPLSRQAARALVQEWLAGHPVHADTVDTIVRKADGVPLFLEELTRMLRDMDETVGQPGAGPAIPDTLMDLLMARLDRLGDARWLAQVAAVIGHACECDLWQALAMCSDEAFAAGLAQLQSSGLMHALDADGQRWVFKHALVAETAYASVALRMRHQLHAKAADRLMQALGDVAATPWERIAHHLTQAGRRLQAAQAWWSAAQVALAQGAPREAEAHLRAGLGALEGHPEGEDRDQATLVLLSALGPTTMVLMGPGAAPFGLIQQQAHALCQRLSHLPGVAQRQFPITYGLCLYHWGRAELAQAEALALTLRAHAALHPCPETRMASSNMSGMVAFHQGNAVAAMQFLGGSVACHDPARDAALYPVYLMDFGVFGRFYLALASWVCGEPERATEMAARAFDLAEQMAQPHSLGFAMLANMIVACMREEVDQAAMWAGRCQAFSAEMGFPEFVAMARVVHGWARARQGDPAQGLVELTDGMAQWEATGFGNWQTWFTHLQVEVLWGLGRLDGALSRVQQQLQRVHATGETQFQSLLMADQARLTAALQGGVPGHAQAVAGQWEAALAVARRQGATAWLTRIQRLRSG